jgi:transposase
MGRPAVPGILHPPVGRAAGREDRSTALAERQPHDPRRSQPLKQQTRLRNRIHAILSRNLLDCPYTDLFGKAGQGWLSEQVLAAEERSQVDSALRPLIAVRTELEAVERPLAGLAASDTRVKHRLTIPGIGLVTALAIVAVVGQLAGSRGQASWSDDSASTLKSASRATGRLGPATSADRARPTRGRC